MLGHASPRCLACGEDGDQLEERGGLDNGRRRILRCRNCGSGIAVRRTWLSGRVRLELIDSGAWGRMEDDWHRAHPIADSPVADAERPEPHELVERLRAAGVEGEPLLFLVAEAASITEAEARALIDPDS